MAYKENLITIVINQNSIRKIKIDFYKKVSYNYLIKNLLFNHSSKIKINRKEHHKMQMKKRKAR